MVGAGLTKRVGAVASNIAVRVSVPVIARLSVAVTVMALDPEPSPTLQLKVVPVGRVQGSFAPPPTSHSTFEIVAVPDGVAVPETVTGVVFVEYGSMAGVLIVTDGGVVPSPLSGWG
jgi:hypothetical protein